MLLISYTSADVQTRQVVGMVPLSLLTALRCGSAVQAVGSSHDLTLCFEGEALRMRTPSAAAATGWLDALRAAATAASPTGQPPPRASFADEGGSLEAAALTADDPQPFPTEKTFTSAFPHSGPSSPAACSAPQRHGNFNGSNVAKASLTSPPAIPEQRKAAEAETPSPPKEASEAHRDGRERFTHESPFAVSVGGRSSVSGSVGVQNIRPAKRGDASQDVNPWAAQADLRTPLQDIGGPLSYTHYKPRASEAGEPEGSHSSRRSPDYGGKWGPSPWRTAPHHRDRRPTHERFPYSPTLSEATQKLAEAQPRAAVPVLDRLYNDECIGKQSISTKGAGAERAHSLAIEALDLHSFDYALRAGLEVDGERGEKIPESWRVSKSKTFEDRQLASGEYTFAPRLGGAGGGGGGAKAPPCGEPGLPSSAASRRADTGGSIWERLHKMGMEQREAERRAEEQAEARRQQPDTSHPYKPQISQRAKALKREGYVEDRLITGWAEKLVAFEEKITAERLAQTERERGTSVGAAARPAGQPAARSAALSGASSLSSSATQQEMDEGTRPAGEAARKRQEAKRQSEREAMGEPLHSRLYREHEQRQAKLEEKRAKEGTEPLERWDGSLLEPGNIRITKRASVGTLSVVEARVEDGGSVIYSAPKSGGAAVASGGGLADDGTGKPAFMRLHRSGSLQLRGRLEDEAEWKAVAAERLSGKTGNAPRSSSAMAVEMERCTLLYERAQEQQRRQKEREQRAELVGGGSGGDSRGGGGEGPAFRSPTTGNGGGMRADSGTPAASGGRQPSSGGQRPAPGSAAKSVGGQGVVMPRRELEAKGAQRHFEAMVRLQQKEEMVLQAQREADAQAIERMQRTAPKASIGYDPLPIPGAHAPSAGPTAGETASERLYQRAVEQQAKLDRQAIERRQQLLDAELAGATFSPAITLCARRTSTDSRPVEQRTMEWHEAKQSRLADATRQAEQRCGAAAATTSGIATPGSGGAKRASATPGGRKEAGRTGNPQFSGGRPVTVDDLGQQGRPVQNLD